MKRILAVFACLLGLAAPVWAEVAPDALVRGVTDDVLSIVREDKDLQSGNARRAMELVEGKVLPHFNFSHMTALALGRDWSKASAEQKEALAHEFKTLLVRTYSNALTQYRDQKIEYKPFRAQAGDTDVTVRTQVMQPGGKAIPIDYSLEKQGEGWKVYDVVVAGVSLVTTYRETFAQEVRNGGVDGLIKTLATKNAKSAGAK